MKILFLTLFSEIGASSRYRVHQYLPYFKSAGINYKISQLISDKYFKINYNQIKTTPVEKVFYKVIQPFKSLLVRLYDIFRAGNYDIVFIQKDILPKIYQIILERINPNIVYEFDDAIFVKHPTQKGILAWLLEMRRKNFPGMLEISKQVIVENNYTKEYSLQYCKNVMILTGPIDTEKYKPNTIQKKCNVILGWIGNPEGKRSIEGLAEPLQRLSEEFTNIELQLIGCHNVKIDGIKITTFDWSLETEVSLLSNFDIGLGPMIEDEYSKGKGGTKLLQYMSCGLPVVATPLEIQNEIVIDKVTGFLPKNNDEWYSSLKTLIENKELRLKMGNAGRERALKDYSLKNAFSKMNEIFNQIIKTN